MAGGFVGRFRLADLRNQKRTPAELLYRDHIGEYYKGYRGIPGV